MYGRLLEPFCSPTEKQKCLGLPKQKIHSSETSKYRTVNNFVGKIKNNCCTIIASRNTQIITILACITCIFRFCVHHSHLYILESTLWNNLLFGTTFNTRVGHFRPCDRFPNKFVKFFKSSATWEMEGNKDNYACKAQVLIYLLFCQVWDT